MHGIVRLEDIICNQRSIYWDYFWWIWNNGVPPQHLDDLQKFSFRITNHSIFRIYLPFLFWNVSKTYSSIKSVVQGPKLANFYICYVVGLAVLASTTWGKRCVRRNYLYWPLRWENKNMKRRDNAKSGRLILSLQLYTSTCNFK